jgi:YVTN family beta-propeller protein
VDVGTALSDVAGDDTSSHVCIANTGSDTVSVLDDRIGHVLRVILVGKRPIDVVKDPVNVQAFVAN